MVNSTFESNLIFGDIECKRPIKVDRTWIHLARNNQKIFISRKKEGFVLPFSSGTGISLVDLE